jgi:hypothetical protein
MIMPAATASDFIGFVANEGRNGGTSCLTVEAKSDKSKMSVLRQKSTFVLN